MVTFAGLLAKASKRYWRTPAPDGGTSLETSYDVAIHVVGRLPDEDVRRLLSELDSRDVDAGEISWVTPGHGRVTVANVLRYALAQGLAVVFTRNPQVREEDGRRPGLG